MTRRMPAQNPGRSRQDYETPPEFVAAVARRFGPLLVDLAASPTNAKAPAFLTEGNDSLASPWTNWSTGCAWLNPPFADIAPWAEKCAVHRHAFAAGGGRILFLTPASVGSEWFAEHVHRKALVLGIRPRLTFVGAADQYPKDLILSVFGELPGFDTWRWKP